MLKSRIRFVRPWISISVVVVFASLSLSARAGETVTLPTSEELVKRVLAWAAARHAEKPRYSFERVADVEELDRDGKVEKRERRIYRSVEIDGESYDRLVTVDGRTLSEAEQEEEAEREKKWKERRAERKNKQKEPYFNRKLADRFVFDVKKRELFKGRDVFVVDFTSDASKDLPEKEDEDRFLNALAGTIWVDAEEYAIVRIDARLTRTVRFGLGLLAYFKKVHLRFEQRRSQRGDWFPHRAKTYAWGRTLLLKPIRVREKSRFQKVKRVR